MRMSRWTPEIVRFMEDAARFTPYFSTIAALVRAVMPEGGLLCDAGCGMGQLSRELAPWAGRIDAIDASPAAIAYVRAHLRGPACERIAPRVGDFASLGARHGQEPVYDCMAFSLSASPREAWRIARDACGGTVVVVNKIKNLMKGDGAACAVRAGGPGARDGAEDAREDAWGAGGGCAWAAERGVDARGVGPARDAAARPVMADFAGEVFALRREGFACEGREFVLEYGQPFRNLDDAQAYYRIFRDRSFPQGVSKEHLATLLERTDNAEFPYYLPIARHVGVVAIDVPATLAALHAKGLRRAS